MLPSAEGMGDFSLRPLGPGDTWALLSAETSLQVFQASSVTQDGLIFLLQPPRWPVIAVPGGSLSALVAQLLETGLAVQLVSRNPYLGRKVIDA